MLVPSSQLLHSKITLVSTKEQLMTDEVVWAKSFPRLYDLYCASDRSSPKNYLEQPAVKKALIDRSPGHPEIESELQQLYDVAWAEFKAKTKDYVARQDKWGWPTPLFDRFNEVKGYIYLKEQGYTGIHFIPELPSQKTPDLIGKRDNSSSVLEVKTINESDDRKDYLTNSGKYSRTKDFLQVQSRLAPELQNKLDKTIQDAIKQLESVTEAVDRRIVFLALELDFDYANQTLEQIDMFLRQTRVEGIEIVCCDVNRSVVVVRC